MFLEFGLKDVVFLTKLGYTSNWVRQSLFIFFLKELAHGRDTL